MLRHVNGAQDISEQNLLRLPENDLLTLFVAGSAPVHIHGMQRAELILSHCG